MLGAVFRYLLKQRLSLLLDYSNLEEHCRVEHCIGIFLEREYPFVLASPYAWPSSDSLSCVYTSIFIVAYDSAEQTVVGSWYIVVVVKEYRCQCRHVHAVFQFLWYLCRQLRVQRMYAFDDEHVVGVHLQPLAALHTLARREVIAWQLHLLTIEQCVELLVHKRQV